MRRKLIIYALLGAGTFWVAREFDLPDYVSTWWKRCKASAKAKVPTPVELDRAEGKLEAMERDVSNMLRPIAEQMAAIKKLKKDIQSSKTALAEQKAVLLSLTKDLEGDP